MKKLNLFFVNYLFCGIFFLVLFSCSKDDQKIISFDNSELEYLINQNEVLNIPVKINNLGKGVFTASVESTNPKYEVRATEIVNGVTEISVVAPKYILEDCMFNINLSIKNVGEEEILSQQYSINAQVADNLVKIASSANTFIVNPGTIVVFPANIGNSTEKADIDKVDLEWQDAQNLISDVQLEDGNVIVAINKDVKGNGLVSGSKDDEKVWNWLLWVNSYDPLSKTMKYTSTSSTDNSEYVFMDRNIGALSGEASVDAFGLFYEWGRKEPFSVKQLYDIENNEISFSVQKTSDVTSSDNVTDIYSYGVKNPMVLYAGKDNGAGNYGWFLNNRTDFASYEEIWGTAETKSVNDPCPAGWRIPPYTAYNFYADATEEGALTKEIAYDVNGQANVNNMGRYISVDGGNTKIFFPNQGEFSNAGAYGYYYNGSTTWPCGKLWVRDLDVVNNRARAIQVSPTSVTLTSGVVTSYGLGIRCVKE